MWQRLRRVTLTQWMLIGMVAGIVFGYYFPGAAVSIKPLSTIFLRAIKSIIVPILFSTLVVGIAGHGDDLKNVGRLALKSIVYFEIVTTLALFVGLVAVNLARPGVGLPLTGSASEVSGLATSHTSLSTLLEHIVPQSFFEAAASNEVLQVVFWSILFGLALARVKAQHRQVVLRVCEGLAETMFKLTGLVMLYAPVGIAAAIAVVVGQSGLSVLLGLGKAVLTLYVALVVFIVAVLVPIAKLAKVPLRRFVAAVKEPALIAFSTTSSEAALPRAMEVLEGLGVPRRIVAFVLPTGYSFNLDGTTLYLAVASIFCAQVAGIHLSIGQQLVMMLTLMLTSKGVAGVPRAALVILAGTVASFGLPLEAVAMLLGVDVLMDMARTTTNLVGNCLATMVLARWEGALEEGARPAAAGARPPAPPPAPPAPAPGAPPPR
ncbi:MAG: cation:dicarboxylase symporter family transporter, partial [Gemmatimonadetes bacterium]|nr:cation:dicarboxylase symporter family transporter [Gemmatimonadota bacterium]